MRWMDFLSLEAIRPALRAHDRDSLLDELAGLMAPESGVAPEVIASQLRAREALGATVMAGGVAIPHCRVEGARGIVTCLGMSRRGLVFGAPEDGRVRIFVGLVAPTDTAGLHLNVLSRIATLLRAPSLRDALLATTTAREAYALLSWAESLHPQPVESPLPDSLHG
ncbi:MULTISPECIES: PTS sugar transporter subunit IIA [Corallococcus]|uniref:PTS sugar transporter subunit IIA n=1 Tax=Corallococcus TaxID=83461 RepID=UPI00117DDC36|nr:MULTISPECIES: PTS sugar transporter subunit IIA [Corallococcus]NBD09678.1 PTS transporter subunit EIIA [Corallococcus silvisoli]TSC24083.1 PTS sugar transporter subunit IIA [Corallococcus sp. Z5C101001]